MPRKTLQEEGVLEKESGRENLRLGWPVAVSQGLAASSLWAQRLGCVPSVCGNGEMQDRGAPVSGVGAQILIPGSSGSVIISLCVHLCSARICEASFSRVRSGCASRAGLVPPFPPWMVGGHSGAPVSPGPWKRTSRAGTWFCLCRFPRGWRESGCKLTFDSGHIPRSQACFSG